ncbi:hypothetical protein GCM10010387_50650 [Streptomyces inusitatus]|uniref:Type II restriction enzyme NaeI domain-containing protein n=1 Tax=Streptomyces inusitatus TaxID=68221 RepID=A0A918QHF0_9ACTN|nr:hypothetical protein GCM10010387_50650 [Streptomyces inusitatus]
MHFGTQVEIAIQREFGFRDGTDMDYRIAGVDVDCKYSQQFGGWTIPPEARGHLCLLVWADDYTSRWSVGLLRVRKEWLNLCTEVTSPSPRSAANCGPRPPRETLWLPRQYFPCLRPRAGHEH